MRGEDRDDRGGAVGEASREIESVSRTNVAFRVAARELLGVLIGVKPSMVYYVAL